MKRVSATLFVLVVILALAGTASAQSTLRANIPFDFTVGDRHLEKGDYIVHVESAVVQLTNVKGSGAMSLVHTASPERQKQDALVFRRYGDAIFLWKILRADGVSRELLQTRSEIEIAKKYPSPARIETAAAK